MIEVTEVKSDPVAAVKVRLLAAAIGLIFALPGCTAQAAVPAHAQQQQQRSLSGRLPLPPATARHLPAGVFYLLCGPALYSLNLWQVDNTGREIQLTHNRPGFGISYFGASQAGIVMADASSGVDELDRLTAQGPEPLPDHHGESPAISSSGQIAYVRPPAGSANFELEVKQAFGAAPRTVYAAKTQFGGAAWGPRGAVAVMSGSHPPGTSGPHARLLVIGTNGRMNVISTGLTQLSEVVWGAQAPLAVADWQHRGVVIMPNGARQHLPSNWTPAAWNAAGTKMLVYSPEQGGTFGLWAPGTPTLVTRIGSQAHGVVIPLVAWLGHPARL